MSRLESMIVNPLFTVKSKVPSFGEGLDAFFDCEEVSILQPF
jgi:hypothetical protein